MFFSGYWRQDVPIVYTVIKDIKNAEKTQRQFFREMKA